MSIKTIAVILDQHGVPYLVQNGRILADSMIAFTPLFSETVDVTDYTLNQLKSWLGY